MVYIHFNIKDKKKYDVYYIYLYSKMSLKSEIKE